MGRFSITLGDYERDLLLKYIEPRKGMKENSGVNELVKRGILKYENKGGDEFIRRIVREQIGLTLKPYTESLAALSSKVAHMSGRSIYLLVQLAVDTFGSDKQMNVKIKEIHDDATKLASNNMISSHTKKENE